MDKNIGRSEKVNFTDLNIDVSAKIDTGAYSIALHVDNIREEDGKLLFNIGDSDNFIFDEFEMVGVKSSFGKTQKRYTIKLKMKLGKKTYKVLVSLTDRKNMKFPCLIGRRFLYKHGFLVDVRKKNLHDRDKKV